MNDNIVTIGIIGAVTVTAIMAFTDSYTIEDATQRWIPAGQQDIIFYERRENDGDLKVVGFTSKKEEDVGKNVKSFYQEKKEENRELKTVIFDENICLDC